MKRALILLYVFSVFFTSRASFAQDSIVVPSDQDYFLFQDDNGRYIYPNEYRALLPELLRHNALFRELYEREFNWSFDDKPATLVLASSQNQIANGFATVFPRLHEAYFNGGSELVDEFSVRSWLYVLLAHETAHLYQLNVKRGYSKTLTDLFGRPTLGANSFAFPLTYMQHPNAFLPTFVLEGNAVYNEGRFGNGGRLYNGAARALLLQNIKAGLLNSQRLMNDHLEFPFGREKYLMGGFFFLELARRHGSSKANGFFFNHADYYANPLQLRVAFEDATGSGYDEALRDLNLTWQTPAREQKSATEAPLFTSLQHAGFTKGENEILFLTTPGHVLPSLRKFDTRGKTWSERKVNLPLGRVFRLSDGEVAVASSNMVSNNEIKAGLFTEGYGVDRGSLGKFFYDIRGSRRVWSDGRSSFFAPNLYVSEGGPSRRLGYSASSAQIGDDQQIYYFRQEGKTRTMMRGTQPVFSYAGFYGIPTEASATAIYFIGPVERGSGFFKWQNGQFTRLHPSDTIVDALTLDGDRALISEITSEGYTYKIVNLNPIAQAPFEYTYFTEKEKPSQLLSGVQPPTKNTRAGQDKGGDAGTEDEDLIPAETVKSIRAGEKEYSEWSEWQFDGIDPVLQFGSVAPIIGSLAIRFSDPLGHHAFRAAGYGADLGQFGSLLQYSNSEHVVNWDILGAFDKQVDAESDNDFDSGYQVLDRWDAWHAATGIDYTFFRRPQWQSKWASHFLFENERPHTVQTERDQRFTFLNQIYLSHAVSPFLSFSPYRSLNLEIAHEYQRSVPDWQNPANIFAADLKLSHDVWHETYLTAGYQTAVTDGQYAVVEFSDALRDFLYPKATSIEHHTDTRLSRNYFYEARKANAQVKQAINVSKYFTVFPVSLRRLALLGEYNEYYASYAHAAKPETLFHEMGWGTEIEFLIAHRFPARLTFMSYKSSLNDDTTTVVGAAAQQSF